MRYSVGSGPIKPLLLAQSNPFAQRRPRPATSRYSLQSLVETGECCYGWPSQILVSVAKRPLNQHIYTSRRRLVLAVFRMGASLQWPDARSGSS